MKVRDWYDLLLKKNMTYIDINKELVLKESRLEIIYPHINHKNSFQNIRKIGLPSIKMSPLWKLKYNLFLTEERKKYCHIAANNRCQACQKWTLQDISYYAQKADPKKFMENF